MQALRDSLAEDRYFVRLHFFAPEQASAHAVDLVRVAPVRFVNHYAVAVDQIDHIGQGAVGAVRRAGEIIDENGDFADLLELAEFLRMR